jgi:hypothetical protein
MEKERWKNIIGYEGLYEISSLGNIYSVRKNKILKPLINRYGYLMVNLYLGGKMKTHSIHRLVLLSFDEVLKNDLFVDHIDRNIKNNSLSNLRWSTNSQNQKNKKPQGKSKYLGVSFYLREHKYFSKKQNKFINYTQGPKWAARININGKNTHIGHFDNEIDAAKKYDEYAKIHHGEFANLNFKD